MQRSPVEAPGATEEKVAAIWRKVLPAGRAERGENFFDLGGSSLGAVKFIAEVENVFGADVLSPEELYRAPTFGAIVAAIESHVRS